jgi:hypothetical protein
MRSLRDQMESASIMAQALYDVWEDWEMNNASEFDLANDQSSGAS